MVKRGIEKKNTHLKRISEIDFIIEITNDKELREAVKECNRNGARVKRFFTTCEPFELACIALRITKENEGRIFNILKELQENECLKIMFSYNENENLEMLHVYGNIRNKAKVFSIVRYAVKRKCNFNKLSLPLQEIYKMHKTLFKEDIEHQIKYNEGFVFQSAVIRNLDNSYFRFGLNRVKNIFSSSLMQTIDRNGNENFNYRFRIERDMFYKLRSINSELEKEFKWQANEFEALCAKYRMDPSDEDSDMFVRLAKVRDEYDLKLGS